ncbi:unnamed protein product, partial [Phaeothamnion confervicola]
MRARSPISTHFGTRFITNLVNAGVMSKDAKELARHSTITLTMDRYAHVGIRDTANAVAKLNLPTRSKPPEEPAQQQMGDLNDPHRTCEQGAAPGAAEGDNERVRLKTGEETGGSDGSTQESSEPQEKQEVEGNQEELMTINERRGRDS